MKSGRSADPAPKARGKRQPRRVTPTSLRNGALHYLNQRSTSRANLRRLLVRRVDRSLAVHEGDRGEAIGWVDALLDDFERAGLLNDELYAEQRARSMARMGNGTRKIRSKLAVKGLASELVDRAIEQLDAGEHSPDMVAACRYARSRRLGPYRRDDLPTEDRHAARALKQKELGKLARAGFSYEIAIRVIESESVEMIDEIISSSRL